MYVNIDFYHNLKKSIRSTFIQKYKSQDFRNNFWESLDEWLKRALIAWLRLATLILLILRMSDRSLS